MPRYSKDFPMDDPALQDGDGGFAAVNDKLAAELLTGGVLARALNLELLTGEARTRRGGTTPAWGRVGVALRGAGIYRDAATGVESIVVFGTGTTGSAWFCAPGRPPRAVALPIEGGDGAPAGDGTETVRAVQAFDRLLIFREEATPAGGTDGVHFMPWETTGAVIAAVDRSELGDGTRPISLTSRAELAGDRLIVLDPESPDAVEISDIAAPLRYDLGNRERIEQGVDDAVIRVYAWTRDTVLIFKRKSVHVMVGVSGDLSQLIIERVKSPRGILAAESVDTDGEGVFFLAHQGVYRIQQVAVVQERFAAEPVAVSDGISRYHLARVNWEAAAGAQGVILDDYYFLAVPLDRQTRNNGLLLYHLPSKQWHGLHVLPTQAEDATRDMTEWRADRLLVLTIGGRRRLVAVDYGDDFGPDGEVSGGCVRVLYEGGHEDLGGTWRLGVITAVNNLEDQVLSLEYTAEADVPAPRFGDTVFTTAVLEDGGTMPTVQNFTPGVVNVLPLDAVFAPGDVLMLGQQPQPIATTTWPRAYTAGMPGRKRWRLARLDVRTRGASWNCAVAVDGNEESTTLEPNPVAGNRARNKDGTAWDTSNAGDDQGDEGREDYAVVCPLVLGSGVVLSREQDDTQSFLAQTRGRTAQVRIASTRGTLAVQAVTVEGTLIDRHFANTQ